MALLYQILYHAEGYKKRFVGLTGSVPFLKINVGLRPRPNDAQQIWLQMTHGKLITHIESQMKRS